MDATSLPLQRYLEGLHAEYSTLTEGAVATYIPELAHADPAWFGIAVATTDGYLYSVGESDRAFTIQSISKPAIYAAALADQERDRVLRKVGVEPSGEAFNSIRLDPRTGAPLNPMVNAGAIATTGLVAGGSADAQWARIRDAVGAFVGHPVDLDEAVYRSESATGYRNRAIAWMLRNVGILDGDPMPTLENYFRQCSIGVSCNDLAFMAATLANDGVHPNTGRRAVASEDVQAVLSIMATCGMYDHAGSWLYDVGLPAKSGVSGGVIAVMPGRLGIAVYSPPLDANGNSVRGLAVCRRISRDFGLHAFGKAVSPGIVLNRIHSALEAPSRRVRSAETAARLRTHAARISIVSLQGDIAFDGAEFVARKLMAGAPESASFVLDMYRVRFVADSAARQLHATRRRLAEQGRTLVYSRIRARSSIESALRRTLARDDAGFLSFEDNDLATEWCENRLLESEAGVCGENVRSIESLADFALFNGLDRAALAHLQALAVGADYPRGTRIMTMGERQDGRLFLIVDGEVSLVVPLEDGSNQRVATLSRGMSFGEMALLDGAHRSTSVFADTAVRVWTLHASDLARLAADHPALMVCVLRNIARDLAQRLRLANQMIGALAA